MSKVYSTCYVVCTDSALSNWKHTNTEGKDNVLCFKCANYSDAEKLYNWIIQNRSEQKRVRINLNPPRDRDSWFLQHKDIESMPNWYKQAGIVKKEWR